jgi:rare lipoprotein A
MKYVFWAIIFSLLASCQTQHTTINHGSASKKMITKNKAPNNKFHRSRQPAANDIKDSAPPGPVPVAFKEVRPKNEPLSRYGNPGAYKVDGRTYEVMTNAHGYRARGLASWYGTKFHSRRTSSGEDYDMYALTAAHKTLPLPTYVRVKNLNNGKQAIVKVNDRGPFHTGRVIDLSYAAAAKLGVLPKGTALVEVEALTLKGAGKPHEARYYLQAGAFSSSQLAESFRGKLSKLTPSPVFVEKYQKRFIVKVGPFATKTMTDHAKIALAHHGVNGAFSVLM